MKPVLIAALLLINGSALADPATVAKQARAWRVAHEREILTEFAELNLWDGIEVFAAFFSNLDSATK